MPTKADTCRKLVVPKLQAAGWEDKPNSIIQQAGKPDAAPFDLLCHHLAFNAPLLARPQRAVRVKRQQIGFFDCFASEAREILSDLLEKYAADSGLQFTVPEVLKVPPISQRGNVAEIAKLLGGFEQLGTAIGRL